ARQRLPRPETVAAGCRVGVSRRHGRAVPVHLADDLLRRQHTLAVAKTRAGKSTLLARIARYLMEDDRQAVVLVDPQRDLARQVLGLVPRERADDVVFLDAADRARPFGLNLLDAGLGWDRDQLVANLLFIFRREFAGFWGPRMEDAFRFAALTLAEANGTLLALDPLGGRERQYTALDVPALLVAEPFRRTVLDLVADPETHDWWRRHWLALREQLRQDSANPVLTKVNKFKGSRPARAVIGQPASTIDPGAWLEGRKIVIVNTGAGEIGVDSSGLIGGTLVNLLKETVAAQQARDRAARDRVTLLVDEFHLLPGADYADLLAGQAKHGANVHFATQSLARLDRAPGDGERALRDAVFDNIRGLFAFHTSAESARALMPELGGEDEVDVEDLVSLDDYRCYMRVSRGAERLPAFLVDLEGPPVGDPAWAARLAAASAARHGTPWERVDELRRASLARIERAVQDARSRQATGIEPLPRAAGPARRAPAGPAKAHNPQRRPKQRGLAGGRSGASSGAPGEDTAWHGPDDA
ncbi:MAG TPA: hypothetical protein VFL91_04275, partial [Thermomicrobiales bacterium]|nr:hypothetical protein [Thermomicrobiales bacterium]